MRGRLVCSALDIALITSACGKERIQGDVAPSAGVYHLDAANAVAALDLRADGTFTIHRDSCVTAGVLECGSWKAQVAGTAAVVPHEGLYWPTPPEFPSTVFRRITLHGNANGDIVVEGESPWAGTFLQRWKPGRQCQSCASAAASASACDAPLPACTPI